MGESACLMHSLSYDTGIPIGPNNQGKHVHALGESISFGRFTSESLAWEKWSTFPHKRYVEEAKSYAQPGSVAQKKAFFEAHYKRIAAQKAAAAALLEQEKAAAASPKNLAEERVCDTSQSTHDSSTARSNFDDSQEAVLKSHNLQQTVSNSRMAVNEEQEIITPDAGEVIDDDGHRLAVNPVDLAIEKNIVVANPMNTESLTNVENLEDHLSGSVDSQTSQTERPLLKSNLNTDQEVKQPMIKKRPAIPSLMSSMGSRPSRIPPPAKYVASVHPRKENVGTPRTKNRATNDYNDKKRPTPKSLEALMNCSSVREPCKLTSPSVRKTESSKPLPHLRNASKRCVTHMKTPAKASINGASKQPLATPSSVDRSLGTPVHPSTAGSKMAGPKSHILSAVSKSLSAYRNRLQSPTISSPFVLRTEGRAARRKQKLEGKFNEKEAQKVLQQTKFKEKAETEFRRLRQSFCFKARPLPDFYKERQTPKSQIKKRSFVQTPEANPKSLMAQRKPPSSRRLWKNNDKTPTHHPRSMAAETISHENISPNIQHCSINTHKAMY